LESNRPREDLYLPYADNSGTRIHYETEGSGPPLVLHHWSLGSLKGWGDYGYVDSLRGDYTVVALDGRGHGASDSPHDPASYALENRIADIVAVLDRLGVERAHYYGYSMGGWIGFGIAKNAPHRFKSLAIGGAHPYEQSMSGLRDLLSVGVDQGARALIDLLEWMSGDFARRHESQWLEADFVAQRNAAQDRTSLEDVLPTIDCPCLLLAGTEDGVFPNAEQASRAIPECRFEELPGLDHGGTLARSDLVVPILRAFLEEVEGRAP
jgi:pimeloyl-ACP methyl ester carboxylesterase